MGRELLKLNLQKKTRNCRPQQRHLVAKEPTGWLRIPNFKFRGGEEREGTGGKGRGNGEREGADTRRAVRREVE